MTHNQKIKLARNMRTHEELKARVPIFETAEWERRKQAIRKRIKKRINDSKNSVG